MSVDIQVTSLAKRAIAFGLDAILYIIMSVLGMLILGTVTRWDVKITDLFKDGYDRYEAEYGVDFDITQEEYEQLPEAEQKKFDEAWEAMHTDETVVAQLIEVLRLTVLVVSLGMLFGMVTQELLFPLWLKNGQTLGKKLMGICVIHTNGLVINFRTMLVRALLGKYVIELLIPAVLAILVLFNVLGSLGLLVAAGVLIAQVVLYFTKELHTPVHDILADTAVVDFGSQTIFETEEELEEYLARLEAERKNRARYNYSQY